MKPIRFRDEAMAEFLEAIEWYEEQEDGLGEAFNVEVAETLRKLATRPLMYPLRLRTVRRALLHRFPYAIYFEDGEDEILVFAVYHLHRDPSDLADR